MPAAAPSALGGRDTTIGWGAEIDVRAIRGDGPGGVSADTVADYAAIYATALFGGLACLPGGSRMTTTSTPGTGGATTAIPEDPVGGHPGAGRRSHGGGCALPSAPLGNRTRVR